MDLRTALYPLGFAASIAFSGRFVIQWLQSEIKGKSIVTPLFWRISLVGNALLMVHAFIQVQFPLCLAQSINLVISWRNLNLMTPDRVSTKRTVFYLFTAATLITSAFVLQGIACFGQLDWVRTPTLPWAEGPGEKLSIFWHILGTIGITLFSSRFWLQWWLTEKRGFSYVTPAFWWCSLSGALLALVYFIRLHDTVNIIGMGFGIIPYIRNLLLPQGEPA